MAKSEPGNFPLHDCSRRDMDFLFLLFDGKGIFERWSQELLTYKFANLVGGIHKQPHRLQFASVFDTFSAKSPEVNVTSWSFTPTLELPKINYEEQIRQRQYYSNPRRLIELKVKFVKRLFSEMAGVRQNGSQVAIIFLDGAGFSFEESRSVPDIVKQQDTDIKIFLVVFAVRFVENIVHLRDTFLVEYYSRYLTVPILMMAICDQCSPGWIPFHRSDNMDYLSCYRLSDFTSGDVVSKATWFEAEINCSNHFKSSLVTIETKEELDFLRTTIVKYLKNHESFRLSANQSSLSHAKLYIGLKRHKTMFANRFHWLQEWSFHTRPLVVNNWLPGQPSGGFTRECSVWQFDLKDNMNGSDSYQNSGDPFVNGWSDVECEDEVTALILCEVVLPRRFTDEITLAIEPATNESSSQALSRGNYRMYRSNIVSVTASVMSTDFLTVFKQVNQQPFPVLDCGVGIPGPRYVSYLYVCDGVDDCSNKQDELFCVYTAHNTPRKAAKKCSGLTCCDGSCLPLQWVGDGEVDCFVCGTTVPGSGISGSGISGRGISGRRISGSEIPGSGISGSEISGSGISGSGISGRGISGREISGRGILGSETSGSEISGGGITDETEALVKSLEINDNCTFYCNDDEDCVGFSQLNDGRQDCAESKGPLDETLGKLPTSDTCYNILGRRIWAPRCVYIRDNNGAIVGCRDVSHLLNCTNATCPVGYFKCPNTYCIPLHYVRDGRVDCPAGEEENNYNIKSCTGNFACWDSKVCLHPDLVCDGHPDCPRQDDEVDCHVKCPDGLRCISGTATVSDYNRFSAADFKFSAKSTTRYLNLSYVDLSDSTFDFIYNLENITVMILSHCNINYLPANFLSYSSRLYKLDLSYNLLQAVDGMISYTSPLENIRRLNLSNNKDLTEVNNLELKFLEVLDLSHTSLYRMLDSFLADFPSLKYLDVSFTKISNIGKSTFPPNRFLMTLRLRGLVMEDFDVDFFNGLTVSQGLYTDSFELCCPQIRGANIPHDTCHAPDDAISSCFDLVGIDVQRVLLWVVAVLAVLGNMTVIAYRVIWDRSVLRTGHGLFVTNLGISDFIMGVYLFIIAGADYYYRDVYVLFDKIWRESVVCRLAGFLATLSCETSTFFVFLITLDRFLLMKFPFGETKHSQILKCIILPLSWIIGLLLALAPTVSQFEIYSSNAMCLGLPLTADRLRGWEFSFAVFIVLNFCLFLFIAYGQRAIFRTMSENRTSRTASRRAQDITVAKQLCLVALSNFLCWFPVGLMGLLSLVGHEISNDVYAWTTVIVLPINAAANPLLYTIPALMAKWERFKQGEATTMESCSK